jgi:hypothetical protein
MTLGLFDVAFLGALSGGSAYDADAQDYINRVIAADVAAGNSSGLEVGVQDAINAFVVGCKADGTWPAIKAACILAAARTLQGCLVPLVGAAPTRFGTAGGWNYNRKTGLQGDGTDNYLDSNRNNDVDPQNNQHVSVFVSANATNSGTGVRRYISARAAGTSTGATLLGRTGVSSEFYSRFNGSTFNENTLFNANSFTGMSRSASASFSFRLNGSNNAITLSSATPASANFNLYRNSSGDAYADCRLAFYSIGEALDLALLDARVTALVNAIAAAIP